MEQGYRNRRYNIPDTYQKYISGYDFSTEELQNFDQTNQSACFQEVLSLVTAQAPANPYILGSGGVGNTNTNTSYVSGRGFKVSGIANDNVYNFDTNAGADTRQTNAFVCCWIGKIGGASDFLLLKNGDGYHGDFKQVFFFWPAQPNTSVRITVFKFNDVPWMSGDAAT